MDDPRIRQLCAGVYNYLVPPHNVVTPSAYERRQDIDNLCYTISSCLRTSIKLKSHASWFRPKSDHKLMPHWLLLSVHPVMERRFGMTHQLYQQECFLVEWYPEVGGYGLWGAHVSPTLYQMQLRRMFAICGWGGESIDFNKLVWFHLTTLGAIEPSPLTTASVSRVDPRIAPLMMDKSLEWLVRSHAGFSERQPITSKDASIIYLGKFLRSSLPTMLFTPYATFFDPKHHELQVAFVSSPLIRDGAARIYPSRSVSFSTLPLEVSNATTHKRRSVRI
jgi:hypothetical protein